MLDFWLRCLLLHIEFSRRLTHETIRFYSTKIPDREINRGFERKSAEILPIGNVSHVKPLKGKNHGPA